MPQQPPLFTPWRMPYIRGLADPPGECFLCAAGATANAQQRRARIVLWTTPLSLVMLNLYPYTNGHLLVAPKTHKAEFEELTQAEQTDLQVQTTRGITLLKRAMSPQGFNLGVNLGRCAGAGLPGHVHQHIVPRWGGDTNFMSIVGEVRVVPSTLPQLYDELLRVAEEIKLLSPEEKA
jgi:ATP adenylyltransferase